MLRTPARFISTSNATGAIAKLITKWDDALYDKHLARAFKDRDGTRAFYDGLRARRVTCAVQSASHAPFHRTILLACERGGDLTLTLTLDANNPDVVTSYHLRPVGGEGPCPVR